MGQMCRHLREFLTGGGTNTIQEATVCAQGTTGVPVGWRVAELDR